MNGYRDDHAAAAERLDRLEAVAEERDRARAMDRLDELRGQRGKLDVRSRAEMALTAMRYLALYIGLHALRSGTAYPQPSATPLLYFFAVAAALVVISLVLSRAVTRIKRARIRPIDDEMDALMAPHVRVAPTELAGIHARIAELEAGDADDVTPRPRTARSAGTSR